MKFLFINFKGDLRISEGDVAISMQFGHVSESKPEETGSFVLIVTESNRYKGMYL